MTQRVVGDPRRRDGAALDGTPGDCLRACLATLLDLPYEQVPHTAQYGHQWWDNLRRWGRARGADFTAATVHYAAGVATVRRSFPAGPPALLIACGPSPRGRYRHAIVATGDLAYVWDPHPSRAGLTLVDEVIAACDPYSDDDLDPLPVLPAVRTEAVA